VFLFVIVFKAPASCNFEAIWHNVQKILARILRSKFQAIIFLRNPVVTNGIHFSSECI